MKAADNLDRQKSCKSSNSGKIGLFMFELLAVECQKTPYSSLSRA